MAHANQRQRTSNHSPSAAYLLAGCVVIFDSNSLVLAPIAPEVTYALGSSTPTVMNAAAAFGLGTAVSALLLARHIDRVDAWRVLQIAFVVLALALSRAAWSPAHDPAT